MNRQVQECSRQKKHQVERLRPRLFLPSLPPSLPFFPSYLLQIPRLTDEDEIEKLMQPKPSYFPNTYGNDTLCIWLKCIQMLVYSAKTVHNRMVQVCIDGSGGQIVKSSRPGCCRSNQIFPYADSFVKREDQHPPPNSPQCSHGWWLVYLTIWMRRGSEQLNAWVSLSTLGIHPGVYELYDTGKFLSFVEL